MKLNHPPADLLLRDISILPGPDPAEFIETGWLTVKDSRIEGIGIGAPPESSGLEIIDGSGCAAIPGLVNAHTHAAMSLFRGLADDLPLKVWLEERIFPAEKKWVDGEFVCRGTLLACAEMIRSGTTTFNDMYMFEDLVAETAREAGIRAVVGEGLIDFPTSSNPTPQDGLKCTERLMERWGRDSLITVAVAPHSCYTCAPEVLRKAKDLSEKYRAPLHIHLSETRGEVEGMREKRGLTPVAYLESLGILSERVIAAHCIHLSEEDVTLIARRRAGVVHNPESAMKLASGVAPVPALRAAGVRVALGTDGPASNNNLDMFGEMDTAAKLHKVSEGDPTVMEARAVLEMATIGGARVLGLAERIGSLEKGKRGDVIVVDLHRPHLVPLYNPYSQIVYAAGGADVETVLIEGRVVMRGRRLLTLNEGRLLSEVRAWAESKFGQPLP